MSEEITTEDIEEAIKQFKEDFSQEFRENPEKCRFSDPEKRENKGLSIARNYANNIRRYTDEFVESLEEIYVEKGDRSGFIVSRPKTGHLHSKLENPESNPNDFSQTISGIHKVQEYLPETYLEIYDYVDDHPVWDLTNTDMDAVRHFEQNLESIPGRETEREIIEEIVKDLGGETGTSHKEIWKEAKELLDYDLTRTTVLNRIADSENIEKQNEKYVIRSSNDYFS